MDLKVYFGLCSLFWTLWSILEVQIGLKVTRNRCAAPSLNSQYEIINVENWSYRTENWSYSYTGHQMIANLNPTNLTEAIFKF